MKSTAVFAVIAMALVAPVNARRPKRIVNGIPASHMEFPYHAFLRVGGHLICGGAIVSPRHIVTAAHCVVGRYEPPVVVTGTILSSGGEVHIPSKIEYHAYYQPDVPTSPFDIAVITLADEIAFSAVQHMIALPTTATPVGVIATASGHGYRSASFPEVTPSLNKIELRTISKEQCQYFVGAMSVIDINQICTYNGHGFGVCNGDSGGPLVFNGELIGVVSYGTPCAIGYPDVFTSVYHQLPWLNSIINRGANMNAEPPQKVVNDSLASDEAIPYQVSLRVEGTSICSGAIVSTHHIVTAAHCTSGLDKPLEIVTGMISGSGGEIHTLSEIAYPENYQPGDRSSPFDIAVITLADEIAFNAVQNMIALPSAPVSPGVMATISRPEYLRISRPQVTPSPEKIELQTISRNECQDIVGYDLNIHINQICTYNGPVHPVCVGDSGTPLVYNGELIGVSTSHVQCAVGYPFIFTSVYHQLPWLNSIINKVAEVNAISPQRIVDDRLDDAFPYHVSLRVGGWIICSGAIVSPRHIVTAAQCIIGLTGRLEIITNKISSFNEEVHKISKVSYPENYRPGVRSSPFDIAVVTLADKIAFNAVQNMIALPTAPAPAGVMATAKRQRYLGECMPEMTQSHDKIKLQTITQDRCQQIVGSDLMIDRNQFCTYNGPASSVCVGDSGTPIAYNGELIGVLTSHIQCAVGYPFIFTSVYHQLPWLNSIINKFADVNAISTKRIVDERLDDAFPYHVSLRVGGWIICSGAIVSPRHIVTAAQCIIDLTGPLEIITSKISSSNEVVHTLSKVSYPENYRPGVRSSPFDIAVITLEDEIASNAIQNMIALPTAPAPAGVMATARRQRYFGKGVPEMILSPREIELHTITRDRCQQIVGYDFMIDRNQFCTFNGPISTVCVGNSGTPIAYNGELIGVSTSHVECGLDYPFIFTSVYHQLPWLNSIINN